MKIVTGTTTTNPNTNGTDRFIEVKLHSTKQVIKAVVGYGIEQDRREQNPNIKVGTEVLLLVDSRNNFYAISSLNQGIANFAGKTYIIENDDSVEIKTKKLTVSAVDGTESDLVEIKTKKISISDGNEEVISIALELIDEVIALKVIGNMGVPAPVAPPTIALLEAVKAKLEPFKV